MGATFSTVAVFDSNQVLVYSSFQLRNFKMVPNNAESGINWGTDSVPYPIPKWSTTMNRLFLPFLLLCLCLPLYGQEAEPVPPQETPPPAETTKTALAIFPFQSQPKIDTRVARSMVTSLTRMMEETGEYSLLDRGAMANLNGELQFTRKGELKTESIAAWGQTHQLAYIITGNVVAAGKGHGGMGIGGVRISAKAISLAVEIQVIECATGELLVEDTFKEEKTGLGLAVGTVEFDPESIRGSEMVTMVLQQVARAVRTAIRPPVVTAIEESGERVTLDYGTTIFQVGDHWESFQQETPEEGRGKATKTGALQITEVREDDATATVLDGTPSVGDVARFDKAAKKKN